MSKIILVILELFQSVIQHGALLVSGTEKERLLLKNLRHSDYLKLFLEMPLMENFKGSLSGRESLKNKTCKLPIENF